MVLKVTFYECESPHRIPVAPFSRSLSPSITPFFLFSSFPPALGHSTEFARARVCWVGGGRTVVLSVTALITEDYTHSRAVQK